MSQIVDLVTVFAILLTVCFVLHPSPALEVMLNSYQMQVQHQKFYLLSFVTE